MSTVRLHVSHLTIEAITARIDRLILQGYLDIECETWLKERLARLDAQLAASDSISDLSDLNNHNREMVMAFIYRIGETGDAKYLPALEAWSARTYKKIRSSLQGAIRRLQD